MTQAEKINWKVEGMTCANCALSVNRALEKEGFSNISVNAISGDVSFETPDNNGAIQQAKKRVEGLGYAVVDTALPQKASASSKPKLSPYMLRFWLCLPFTAVLMLHMVPGLHLHFLMEPLVNWGFHSPCI